MVFNSVAVLATEDCTVIEHIEQEFLRKNFGLITRTGYTFEKCNYKVQSGESKNVILSKYFLNNNRLFIHLNGGDILCSPGININILMSTITVHEYKFENYYFRMLVFLFYYN